MSHQINMTYIFGDLLTGSIIQEIPLQGVSMTRGFGMGDFRGSFTLDQTGKDNRDLLASTEPGRCYVVCERNDNPIWGGFVWTRTYQSQAKMNQLYCRAFEHYPSYRTILEDFEYTNIEQRNIFLDLWTSMMEDPNSVQFTLPSSFPDAVLKSLSIRSFEYKSYREGMDSLSNADDGFDWTVDVNRVSGSYTKSLRIGYPRLGATEPIDFDYPGSVVNYWRNESMAERGTHFFGIGAGEGSTMIVQPVTHGDLISAGFPRYDSDISFKSVTDPTILSGLTAQAASARKPGVPIYTVELKADKDPAFGSYGLGDAVRFNFVDPAHPDPINRKVNSRILGWEYYPPSDEHTEMARLVLEGEQ